MKIKATGELQLNDSPACQFSVFPPDRAIAGILRCNQRRPLGKNGKRANTGIVF